MVETLDQVRTQEPTAPSRRQAGVALDLDTICLKCLRKEPENRYVSAAELADELVRYQRGEPILARPVGVIERTIKWVKRHPVVSGALVVALGIAIVIQQMMAVAAHRNLTERAQTAVATMANSRGVIVPRAIEELEKFPRAMVLEELQARFVDGKES